MAFLNSVMDSIYDIGVSVKKKNTEKSTIFFSTLRKDFPFFIYFLPDSVTIIFIRFGNFLKQHDQIKTIHASKQMTKPTESLPLTSSKHKDPPPPPQRVISNEWVTKLMFGDLSLRDIERRERQHLADVMILHLLVMEL